MLDDLTGDDVKNDFFMKCEMDACGCMNAYEYAKNLFNILFTWNFFYYSLYFFFRFLFFIGEHPK